MEAFREAIETELSNLDIQEGPENLYSPLRYFMELGGKRVRPALVLMGCELFDSDWRKALDQAVAIEMFHNFTLIHDDIMDNSDIRRNKPTIHKKWNQDIAILSGDVLLVKAYQKLSGSNQHVLAEVLSTFNEMATLVCEGQQMDMDFEERSDVQLAEYLEMIRLKTAVLLGASLRIGALIGGATTEQATQLAEFGDNLGVAFQLQDDYLDAFGDPETFGKTTGGDILNDKKTYLSIRLKEIIGEAAYAEILRSENRVPDMLEAYETHGLKSDLAAEVETSHTTALEALESLNTNHSTSTLKALAQSLMTRIN